MKIYCTVYTEVIKWLLMVCPEVIGTHEGLLWSEVKVYEVCLIQNRKDEMKKKFEVLQHTLFLSFSPPSYPLAF